MKTENKVFIGIGLLTLIIIIGGVWLSNKEEVQNQEKLSKPMMGEKIPDMGGEHVARGATHSAYNSNPPTSGPHWADVAGPGIKDEPIPDELVLHSMEHGAVVIWYKEGLEQSRVNRIKEVFNHFLGKKIMLPRKDLDVPVALTSWGYLLKLNTVDEQAMIEFMQTNSDRGPEQAPI
ncbi:MAG: DUF3105 domain-containing protein [Candidatus Nomurabacteria bacterium]|nr:DUF3105 domain-containing protein [Candidatus Nomurabacteria bacterium]